MKHTDHAAVDRVLAWLGTGTTLDRSQWEQLDLLADWLAEEAVAGGGLGPGEPARIWPRHLADSLTFVRGWAESSPPAHLLDVGAGVGLPGIPLAILWPTTLITLLDRSVRRVDLARRAVRQLGLSNVEVVQGDVLEERRKWGGVVFRAVFPPERAGVVGESLLDTGGVAVIGLRGPANRRAATLVAPGQRSTQIVDVPATVLDGAASLLIMGTSEH